MAAAIKATFAQCKKEGRSALVGYFTSGYPTAEETPDIMLGLQAGGVGELRTPPFHMDAK
jgi:tryptophan synthase alpha subunit